MPSASKIIAGLAPRARQEGRRLLGMGIERKEAEAVSESGVKEEEVEMKKRKKKEEEDAKSGELASRKTKARARRLCRLAD